MNKISNKITVRPLQFGDITNIIQAFTNIGWDKPHSLFITYFKEVQQNHRLVWIAVANDFFAGYITLKWQSEYKSFYENNIPEIIDLNVLPNMRKQGIGSKLMDYAERAAAVKGVIVGIGVGLYTDHDGGYGSAQKMYIKRGFIPDGLGLTYNSEYVKYGEKYPIDDNLILWLTKKL